MEKPRIRPLNPCFSSGPCAKRPGWTVAALEGALTGRSHRAAPAKARLQAVIEKQRTLLGIPQDYKIGIVPASDTGAFEMALWSLAGANPHGMDVFTWEAFSADWLKDLKTQLKPEGLRIFEAPYGQIPDLAQAGSDRDTVFVWNGTTSGVRVPSGSWIAAERTGLTFCDATSAVFACDLPWDKLDIVTWSWQKVLGGEGAHGILVLSPRAVERVAHYSPPWPLPKIFRIKKGSALDESIFEGATINTPSMLAVEDCLDALNWVERIGGLPATIARSTANFDVIANWVAATPWVDFLAQVPETRSTTSVCLKITDPAFTALPDKEQQAFVKTLTGLLDKEGVAFDIAGYRDAPAGLRIWCGATVETPDVSALVPWLDWAFMETKARGALAGKAA